MANKQWSSEDTEKLIELWATETLADDIAALFGRSKHAVYNKVKLLRSKGLLPEPGEAYLPDVFPITPCKICATPFWRTTVVEKYCSDPCRKASYRKSPEDRYRREDGMCPRCGEYPRSRRPSGTLRPYCVYCERAWYREHRASLSETTK